jgi:hypothetical protein
VKRRELERHLADNPSLSAKLPDLIEPASGDALLLAARETGLGESSFPASCPWSLTQLLDSAFWPGPDDAGQ